ncbi:hypothetical protein MNBD_GAMMA01-1314 [hydrothermal vent metagenome]|uniref:Uncharacterized protein n=1 Tax=hydrothermal vent metagenome TaxID=652676 RepID=A0A3B0VF59_9ZZZZ
MKLLELIQKELEAAAPTKAQKRIVKWSLPIAIACPALLHFLRHLLPPHSPALITLVQILLFLLVVNIAFVLLYLESLKVIKRLKKQQAKTQKQLDELSDGVTSYLDKHGVLSKPAEPKSINQQLSELFSNNS